jgi:hypothetical protein
MWCYSNNDSRVFLSDTLYYFDSFLSTICQFYDIMYLYILYYKRYKSPRVMDPLVHHLNQSTGHRLSQSVCMCDQSLRTPVRDRAHAPHVDPVPPGLSRTPIEPTRPRSSQQTLHSQDPMRLSHFRGSLSHFDKASTIFQFLASHFCYSAQPF